jgi:glycine/D-amino acid oxidase-like deaminating enzyme
VRARRGVVVAAGVWSGQLLADATGQQGWRQLLQPRRGHLLEMQPPAGMPPLHTGGRSDGQCLQHGVANPKCVTVRQVCGSRYNLAWTPGIPPAGKAPASWHG